jgi:hypothetical protein
MASEKYATMNLLKEDYEPFKVYCLGNNLIIKDELAKALQEYLENKKAGDATQTG